jgi:RHH-type rel operon transcriptional repressor/antitoxin RelB
MPQITTRLPDDLVESLDKAAGTLHRTRAEIVRQAIERYLEDFEDLSVAVERLKDPSDPVLDWDDVKRELLRQD